jgi:hypothetical protein
VVKCWIERGEFLITKYNDGYVKERNGRLRGRGYSFDWLETVLNQTKTVQATRWG